MELELSMPKRKVAVLIPCCIKGKISSVYLQKRDKDAKRLPDWFGFFGGGVEEGETSEAAMLREIKEELEYVPLGYKHLGYYESTTSDKWVYCVEVPKDFESQIIIHEGQYGKWFTEEEMHREPLLTEGDKAVLRDFFALTKKNL